MQEARSNEMLGQRPAGNYHEDFCPSHSYWNPDAQISGTSVVPISDQSLLLQLIANHCLVSGPQITRLQSKY